VKIVDKGFKGGRFYLKKGVVVDVSAPTVCDVFIEGTREAVQGLRQGQLETVVPGAEGAALMVVAGKLRGR
jgi:G patch domain/KOW motif-containing protein